MNASFLIVPNGDAAIVDVNGEVDLSNVQEFRNALEEARGSGKPMVVASFENTAYVDSTTINALVEESKKSSEQGVRLCVVVPKNSKCTKIFKLVELDRLLDVRESIDALTAT